MRRIELDDHTADYWVRQIRLGAATAAVITTIGGARIALFWPAASRWWLIPVAVAILVQAATLWLPWSTFVRSAKVRRWLLLWWLGELPILVLFGIADPDGTMLYLPAAVLLLITAAALWSPRPVVLLGGLASIGYAVLLPVQAHIGMASTVTLSLMMSCVVALTAIGAQSRRQLDDRRRIAEGRAETLLEASADAVVAFGRDGTFKYVSPSVERLLGYPAAALTGANIAEIAKAERLPEMQSFLRELLAMPLGQSARAESRLIAADGTWVYVDVIGTNWTDDPDLQAAVISLRDIGPRRDLETQLSRQAFTDSLTGLANRAMFRTRLAEAVAESAATPVTVLLIDVDDFKLVNDNLGHSAGDELLATIADRLRGQMRARDLLARLGGDEFAVLLFDLQPGEAAALAERLLVVARQPVRIASRDVSRTLSIGMATSTGPDDAGAGHLGTDPPGTLDVAEQLLGNVDLAMYAAKRAGRNGYATFDPTMAMAVLQEVQLRTDLERALEQDEFLVLYQPVVDMQTGHLTSTEALVRWEHPRDGLLGPHHFIAAAEANGLIVPLGTWILRQACAQLSRWRAETPQAAGLKVNVNLSARQFQYAGLVEDVSAALADSGLEPASLTLEITESMLMEDIETAKETLHALRRLGVRLAIDDFGTGYSSLSYLKQLPVDIIKIDKTFVDEVHIDEDDVALVAAVAGLGAALKMQTVAEGIETDAQWATLRRLGIDHGQGYLFGKPAGPAEITAMLESNRADQATTADRAIKPGDARKADWAVKAGA